MAFTTSIAEVIANDHTGLLTKHPSWERVPLEVIASILNGAPFDSALFSTTANGFPLVRIRDVVTGCTSTYYTGTYEDNYIVHSGDLLIGMDGDFNSAFWNSKPALLNQRVCKITPNGAHYLKSLLGYVLPGYLAAINANTPSVTVKHLSSLTIGKIELPLPPIAEQTRIVTKLEELLSDLDAGVAELKAAQKKLTQYRQSLLKAAVEGRLTAQWRTDRARRGEPIETGAQLLQRILQERRTRWETKQRAKFAAQSKTPPQGWQSKYPEPVKPDTTDLPELPEGWVWASVDQLCFVIRGASPRPAGDPRYFGGNIPWITVGSITRDDEIYLERTEQFVTEAGKETSRFIEIGTLLLTNSGATLGVPKIAKIGGCINDGSVALLDVDEITKLYLYWFLKTQTERLRALNQGAAQPNLNTDIVRRISVPICARSEMLEVIQVIDETIKSAKIQERTLEVALKQSAAQRKNILRAAFSGQLVPQDPSDEPASQLLARIRAERSAHSSEKTSRGRKRKTEITV
jgi:type I restriction enzyme S subunit